MSGNGKEVPKICCTMMFHALMDGKFGVGFFNGYRTLTLGSYGITYCPYCGDEIIYGDAWDNDNSHHKPRRFKIRDEDVVE